MRVGFLHRLVRRPTRVFEPEVASRGVSIPSRAILEALAEGVLYLDEEGRVVLSNRAAQRLLGVEAAELPGGCVWDVMREPALQHVVRAALEDDTPQALELSMLTPEERLVRVEVTPVSQRRVVLVLRDVTALRHLERVRQDFVANVSHELRTPLTSIKGFIETLLDGALDDPTHNRRFLRLVEGDVDRLARLTDDLLELSKAELLGKPKSIQPVDTLQLIQDVIAALTSQAKARRVAMRVDHLGPVPHAKGDPDQLRQVFWNLLDNAVKYNVEGGLVVARLRHHKGFLYVEVEDSGIGIPPDELPRIFERFYRVDKARSRALGGTGLGLAIVKHIVEAHDGQISVASQPGQGSTFRVTLPVW